MILFGVVSETFHRSASSVVAALVPSAHEMAKGSCNSNVRGASSREARH